MLNKMKLTTEEPIQNIDNLSNTVHFDRLKSIHRDQKYFRHRIVSFLLKVHLHKLMCMRSFLRSMEQSIHRTNNSNCKATKCKSMNTRHDHSCFHHHILQVPLLYRHHKESNILRWFSEEPNLDKHRLEHMSCRLLTKLPKHPNNLRKYCQGNKKDSLSNCTSNTNCWSIKWRVMKSCKLCRLLSRRMWCSMKNMVGRDVKCLQSKQSHRWLRWSWAKYRWPMLSDWRYFGRKMWVLKDRLCMCK